MLLQVISATFGDAIAIMVSPIPLIALIMVLMGGKAGSKGLAFTLGWYAAVMGLIYLGISIGSANSDEVPSLASGIFQLIVGMFFAYIAIKQLYTAYTTRTHPTLPPFLEKVAQMSPGRVFVMAAVVTAVNAKNIPVTLHAVSTVIELPDSASMTGLDTFLAALAFTTITAIPYIAVTLWANFGGEGVTHGLERLKDFMTHYNHLIMGGLFVMLGANAISGGLTVITANS